MSATCGARTKRCRKCGHKYPRAEYDLWNCPECGEDRACRTRVQAEGLRCRLHGGASLAGIASPLFKHGRYGNYLPPRLVGRYAEARADTELLALRDEIALLDVRLTELVGRIGVGESTAKWERLQAVHADLEQAHATEDVPGMVRALQALGEVIREGGQEGITWDEIVDLLDRRRKLVESERRRLVEMRQMITVEQALALLARVQQVILENVVDGQALATIGAEFKRLALVGPGGGCP